MGEKDNKNKGLSYTMPSGQCQVDQSCFFSPYFFNMGLILAPRASCPWCPETHRDGTVSPIYAREDKQD